MTGEMRDVGGVGQQDQSEEAESRQVRYEIS